MENPSFSISVPIGAYHPLLRDCLESLAIQDPRPSVAVLDASGDQRVAEVVAAYADLVSYYREGPDGGQSDAIIEGWNNTQGDILGWLNADDALYPGALSRAAREFKENPDTDLFYGHTTIIDDDELFSGYHWAVDAPSDAILSGDYISQPSCFFRRLKVDEIGGLDQDLHYTMDWDLWVRLWRAGAKFSYTESVLSKVLWSSDAKTGGFNKRRREELERIIGANSSHTRRLKSRIGFALHHLFEYVTPPSIADVVRGLPFRQMRQIGGLDRLGRVGRKAHLPLVHYRPLGACGLAVLFKANGPVSLSANGSTVMAGDGECILQFEGAVPSGETVMLKIENVHGHKVRLLGVRWLFEG